MKRVIQQIKNFIQLHTSDMENEDYISLMRELAEWTTSQADIAEYSDDTDTVFPIDE
ncbi:MULTISPECIES: hypothetical protein [Muribaculaceae]|nr:MULTISPECIES: hypothetical protein [Muribaculaceae]MCX4276925.1 hypothetical protein [Muribaculum sp.]